MKLIISTPASAPISIQVIVMRVTEKMKDRIAQLLRIAVQYQ